MDLVSNYYLVGLSCVIISPGLLFFSAQAVDVDVVLVGGQVGHTEGGAQVGHVGHVGHVGGGGQVQSSHSSQQLSHGAGAGQGVDSHVTTSAVRKSRYPTTITSCQ